MRVVAWPCRRVFVGGVWALGSRPGGAFFSILSPYHFNVALILVWDNVVVGGMGGGSSSGLRPPRSRCRVFLPRSGWVVFLGALAGPSPRSFRRVRAGGLRLLSVGFVGFWPRARPVGGLSFLRPSSAFRGLGLPFRFSAWPGAVSFSLSWGCFVALSSFSLSVSGLASSSSFVGAGLALSFSGAGRFGRCASVRRLAAAAGLPSSLLWSPAAGGFLVLVVGPASAARLFAASRPWLRLVGVPAVAVAAGSAIGSGAARWAVRPSSRALSGAVLVAGFASAVGAGRFARLWAGRLPLACRGVVVRRRPSGLFAVSVPVAGGVGRGC